MKLFFWTLLIFICQHPTVVLAQEQSDIAFPYGDYLKSITFIILLLIGFLFAVKVFFAGKSGLGPGQHLMRVADRIQIEPNTALYLIKLKEKTWLLSVSNKQVTPIDDVSELITDIELEAPATFKETLDKIVNRHEKNNT